MVTYVEYGNNYGNDCKKYCRNSMLGKIGAILHCYNCKNNRYIDLNCCNDVKQHINKNFISCLTCENTLKNTSENDIHFFKERDKIIKKKLQHMLKIFFNYTSYPELKDLPYDKIQCIYEIIKILLINQTNSYDYEVQLIHPEYLLIKIFEMLEININKRFFFSNETLNLFDNRFNKIRDDSFYDIARELTEFQLG